jgi:hypothetical protein
MEITSFGTARNAHEHFPLIAAERVLVVMSL